MKERIEQKIEQIEEFLQFIAERVPETKEEYAKNYEVKAICERNIEKIIEGVVSIAFLTVKHKQIKIPAETADAEIFDILKEKNIISETLCRKMQDAKHMRNIIAHEYGRIDDGIVYHALKEELIPDVQDFIRAIKEHII